MVKTDCLFLNFEGLKLHITNISSRIIIMKKAKYLRRLVKEDDVKVNQILRDHWQEFNICKFHRVPADMRSSVVM